MLPRAFRDGSVLATVSVSPSDRRQIFGTLCQLWNVTTGEILVRLPEQQLGFATLDLSPDGKMLATAIPPDTIHVWEVATGRERRRLGGHRGIAFGLTFSRDGRLLASGGSDNTAVVWDTRSLSQGEPLPTGHKALWAMLAEPDAARSYRAMCSLMVDPSVVPFLRQQLRPVAVPEGHRIKQLVADLDQRSRLLRDRASRELEQLGDLAEPALPRLAVGTLPGGSPGGGAAFTEARGPAQIPSYCKHCGASKCWSTSARSKRGKRSPIWLAVRPSASDPRARAALDRLAKRSPRER